TDTVTSSVTGTASVSVVAKKGAPIPAASIVSSNTAIAANVASLVVSAPVQPSNVAAAPQPVEAGTALAFDPLSERSPSHGVPAAATGAADAAPPVVLDYLFADPFGDIADFAAVS